ncbi:Protein impA [Klebsiella pneumoniae]|nr:Protein impA [Klebsiella pneumoniae]
MKLQLFSTGKELPPQAHPLLPIWPAAVFPALLLTMSSPIWISMITAYGIRARRTTCVPAETAWPTAVCTMAICWLWTVLKKPRHGDIVVASMQGEFTVKRLLLTPRLTLQPMNASWSPIYPDPDELDIFGVVTHIIHRPREMY